MTDADRALLDAARRRGLAARKLAKFARLRHGIARRWADADGHHGRCRCGHRVTGRTSVARDQALVHHISEAGT